MFKLVKNTMAFGWVSLLLKLETSRKLRRVLAMEVLLPFSSLHSGKLLYFKVQVLARTKLTSSAIVAFNLFFTTVFSHVEVNFEELYLFTSVTGEVNNRNN